MSFVHDPLDRKSPRYVCDFSGHLEVICPELTFTPRSLRIQAQDLSESGCRLMATSISKDLYKNIVREVRPVTIELRLPDGRTLVLRGELVWSRFEEGSAATLGISFNGLKRDSRQQLANLLQELNRVGAVRVAQSSRPQDPFGEDTTKCA